MPRFAANLTMMFNELPFLDRFDAAADAGFEAVEFLFPYDHPPEAIGAALRRNGLTDRIDEVKAGVTTALAYAEATGVKRLHLMAGLAEADDPAAQNAYRRAVDWCARELGRVGLDLVLEPINGRNMPGYFLNDFSRAAALIRELGLPNVKLQFDLYHCQIMHGDVVMRLRELMPIVGHVQTASVPDRTEPGTGEMNDAYLFAQLDLLGCDGFVGCEYMPAAGTVEGLGWFAPYRRKADAAQ